MPPIHTSSGQNKQKKKYGENEAKVLLAVSMYRGGVGSEDDDDDAHGYDAEYGIGGDAGIHNMARYVAVAPRNVSTSLRYLDFETGADS